MTLLAPCAYCELWLTLDMPNCHSGKFHTTNYVYERMDLYHTAPVITPSLLYTCQFSVRTIKVKSYLYS